MLDILLHLGVSHVTVYAFAIDNFQRDEEEVEHLMDLARTKLVELCEKGHVLRPRPLNRGTDSRWTGRCWIDTGSGSSSSGGGTCCRSTSKRRASGWSN